MQTNLAGYDNAWYRPGSPLKRGCWYVINAVIFNSAFFPFYGLKVFLLRAFGASVGAGVFIKPHVNIKYPWFLSIGNHVWIGEKVWIDNLGKVIIGNDVCLSQGCLVLSGNHNYKKPSFDLVIKDIVIEDGVWIGAGAMVCGGVTCKTHSVLSAGSVTAKDLDSFSIYTGNPALKVRERIFD